MVGGYIMIKNKGPFKFWCQKTLPLVYDDSLSYYEILCKVVNYLNNNTEDLVELANSFDELSKKYIELKGYVDNYFNSLDVQEEINKKLDEMASDGTLSNIIKETLGNSKKLRGYEICNMVTIGDSYALGTSFESSVGGSVVTGKGWPYWLSTTYHYNVKNYASGGAGFIEQGTSGDLKGRNFKELAEYCVNELKESIKDVEYVIISGGINDSISDQEKLEQEVENCISYIMEKFVSATVLVGSTTLRGNSDCATAGDIRKGIIIKNKCILLGAGYIENSTNFFNGNMKKYDSGDTIHPNEKGYKFMSDKIQSYINTSYVFDDFTDYVGNSAGNMNVGDMCTSVSVNPPRIICERGVYTLKGAVLIKGEYNSAQRIVTGLTVPPLNYNVPQPGTAVLYNPTDAVFIGTTIYDLVLNPDSIHYDIRLQRMYNPTDHLYNTPIPDGTRVYLNPICFNIVF